MNDVKVPDELVILLSGKNRAYWWDILTALRGCDTLIENNDVGTTWRLKCLTTGRIRAIVGLGSTQYERGIVRTKPLNIEECAERDRLLTLAPKHFVEHYNNAVFAISKVYGWDLRTETTPEGANNG